MKDQNRNISLWGERLEVCCFLYFKNKNNIHVILSFNTFAVTFIYVFLWLALNNKDDLYMPYCVTFRNQFFTSSMPFDSNLYLNLIDAT